MPASVQIGMKASTKLTRENEHRNFKTGEKRRFHAQISQGKQNIAKKIPIPHDSVLTIFITSEHNRVGFLLGIMFEQ